MSIDSHGRRPSAGFTLIESVVALLIVALGMTAVFVQLNQSASMSFYLRDKTLASWIGSNVVTELSLQSQWPALGDTEEEIEYAGRRWIYTVVVAETDVDNLRRVDVEVALEERPERIIHTVTALIEPPFSQNFPPVNWDAAGRGPSG